MVATAALNDLELMEEIVEDWQDRIEDGETVTFPDALQGYYGNLMDDLHDSRGDKEHQDGLLVRMAIIEKWAEAFTNPESEFAFRAFDEAEKAVETEWNSELGEGDVR